MGLIGTVVSNRPWKGFFGYRWIMGGAGSVLGQSESFISLHEPVLGWFYSQCRSGVQPFGPETPQNLARGANQMPKWMRHPENRGLRCRQLTSIDLETAVWSPKEGGVRAHSLCTRVRVCAHLPWEASGPIKPVPRADRACALHSTVRDLCLFLFCPSFEILWVLFFTQKLSLGPKYNLKQARMDWQSLNTLCSAFGDFIGDLTPPL